MKRILAAVCVTMAANGAFAQNEEQKSVGAGPNPYRDCGIGAALFPSTNWAAVTSNVIWDIGTTAVTSATVSPETCQDPNRVAMADYIKGSYASLEVDLIRGQGEWVEGLTSVSGCSVGQTSAFVGAVRRGLREAYTSNSFADMSDYEKGAYVYHVADAASADCGA